MYKNIFICFALLTVSFNSSAKSAVEPETCILNTLGRKSQSSGNDGNMIRYNCIRQFYKDSELKSIVVNKKLLSQVTLGWYPKIATIGYPYYLNEKVRVDIKNNSNSRIIFIMITIVNNQKSTAETYKLYAENIVEPFAVGSFYADVILDSAVNSSNEFFTIYSWDLISVHGLTK